MSFKSFFKSSSEFAINSVKCPIKCGTFKSSAIPPFTPAVASSTSSSFNSSSSISLLKRFVVGSLLKRFVVGSLLKSSCPAFTSWFSVAIFCSSVLSFCSLIGFGGLLFWLEGYSLSSDFSLKVFFLGEDLSTSLLNFLLFSFHFAKSLAEIPRLSESLFTLFVLSKELSSLCNSLFFCTSLFFSSFSSFSSSSISLEIIIESIKSSISFALLSATSSLVACLAKASSTSGTSFNSSAKASSTSGISFNSWAKASSTSEWSSAPEL